MKNNKILEKTTKHINNLQITDKEKKQYLSILNQALEITDKEKQLSYLYDEMCDYLDNEFKQKNLCGFCGKLCKRRQDLINRGVKKETYDNGCCYSYSKKENCKYLGVNGCTIKCLGCKLFTCFYLRKTEKARYKIDTIPFAKYFFNARQKFYMENTFFTEKEIIIKEILKRG